jgi:hypothetical protein
LAIGSATEAERIEPVAASEGFEPDSTTAEVGLVPEIEDIVVATRQEETEPVMAGTTSVADTASLEVQDPLEVQNEPELPDLGVGAFDSHCSGGPVPEEATSSGNLAWWGTVGPQEDPVLSLRHRIEV